MCDLKPTCVNRCTEKEIKPRILVENKRGSCGAPDSENITKNKVLIEILEELIEYALDEVYTKDLFLLEKNVHERAIVFRFGFYLKTLMDKSGKFIEYNLDCEYNRNGDDVKRLPSCQHGAIPDLIIHKRGSNKYNLLVVEFKPYWRSNVQADCNKLKQFVSSYGEYKYFCAKSIVLKKTRKEVEISTLQ